MRQDHLDAVSRHLSSAAGLVNIGERQSQLRLPPPTG
jgi:hypothetical protein